MALLQRSGFRVEELFQALIFFVIFILPVARGIIESRRKRAEASAERGRAGSSTDDPDTDAAEPVTGRGIARERWEQLLRGEVPERAESTESRAEPAPVQSTEGAAARGAQPQPRSEPARPRPAKQGRLGQPLGTEPVTSMSPAPSPELGDLSRRVTENEAESGGTPFAPDVTAARRQRTTAAERRVRAERRQRLAEERQLSAGVRQGLPDAGSLMGLELESLAATPGETAVGSPAVRAWQQAFVWSEVLGPSGEPAYARPELHRRARIVLLRTHMAPKRRYWLFKSEPDAFSFDDLWKAKGRKTLWDGVRNYQARNLLRDEIAVGDGVLYYHSSCKPPGVAGVAQVVRAGYPDPTQFDPADSHHDPKSDPDDPRWFVVDIRAVERGQRFVPLDELRAEARLADMSLLRRGNRLSVQPVTAAEWKVVLRLLGAKKGV